MDTIRLNLELENKKHLLYHDYLIKEEKEELLNFINDNSYLSEESFPKSIMMRQELKANNLIEGINNDLKDINNVIVRRHSNMDKKERQRIINLYHGYKYVLKKKEINKETLRELYNILSKDILEKEDRVRMGKYYRTDNVYILKGGRLDIDPFLGMKSERLDYFMDMFLDYVNSNSKDSGIEEFIKSQVMHFYFVYIHPYFDVNGRTSRTVSMWYLLNNKCYPYTIFNSAITYSRPNYDKAIEKSRTGDVTYFLRYMLICVLEALEKDYVIRDINNNSKYKMNAEEKEIIEYLLTMKGNFTAKDLSSTYNRYNEPKKYNYILKNLIMPLIDKEIIEVLNYTKNKNNMKITINNNLLDIDNPKIKHISLDKFKQK